MLYRTYRTYIFYVQVPGRYKKKQEPNLVAPGGAWMLGPTFWEQWFAAYLKTVLSASSLQKMSPDDENKKARKNSMCNKIHDQGRTLQRPPALKRLTASELYTCNVNNKNKICSRQRVLIWDCLYFTTPSYHRTKLNGGTIVVILYAHCQRASLRGACRADRRHHVQVVQQGGPSRLSRNFAP